MTRGCRHNPIHTMCAAVAMLATLVPTTATAQSPGSSSRVRSQNPMIAELLADAPVLSSTFHALVTAIDGTNGIVYVESGRCGRGARACLVLDMQVAGPSRILRIVITTRRDREGLIGSIGHELHHAWEILQQPAITTSAAMFFHYFGRSSFSPNRFETDDAVEAGHRVEHEVRSRIRVQREEPYAPTCAHTDREMATTSRPCL